MFKLQFVRKMSGGRRQLIVAACLIGALVGVGALTASINGEQIQGPIKAGAPSDGEGRQVALRDQLRVGLKARTKADLEFIDLVVQRVNEGKLPRKLVDSTFLWARYRARIRPTTHPLRPIVYFQPALVLRAKAIGVRL
jgi:hypothetical protein